jgi:predicted  nucleic acid-binding Zn-ribbon protein
MKEELKTICRIQVLDADVYAARQRLEAIPQELNELNLREKEGAGAMQEVGQKLAEGARVKKAGELDLESATASLRKLHAQLPQVKTNKEYTAMQHEIELGKAKISDIEERILLEMERLDALAIQEKEFSRQHDLLKKNLDGKRKILLEQLAQMETKLTGLLTQREVVIKTLPAEIASVYHRIMQGRPGTAVVPVNGSSCGGCFASLPPQFINEIKKMEKLITCETCGRILVWSQEGI